MLRILRYTDLVVDVPVFEADHLRCEARSAFQRAFATQVAALPGMRLRRHDSDGTRSYRPPIGS